MRRSTIAICLCLVVALLPAAAAAATKTQRYSGTVREGGTVQFKATTQTKRVKRHGKHKKVTVVKAILPTDNFLTDIPVTCNEGQFLLTWGFSPDPFAVKDGKFAASLGGGATRISGKANRKGTVIQGTFRETDADIPPATDCSTPGTLHWEASR